MVRTLGEVLQSLDGHGFHIYDDGGARWIMISYKTGDAAKESQRPNREGAYRRRFCESAFRRLSPIFLGVLPRHALPKDLPNASTSAIKSYVQSWLTPPKAPCHCLGHVLYVAGAHHQMAMATANASGATTRPR
jgi:hypothetical protein